MSARGCRRRTPDDRERELARALHAIEHATPAELARAQEIHKADAFHGLVPWSTLWPIARAQFVEDARAELNQNPKPRS